MYDIPPTGRDLRRERLGTRVALLTAALTVAAVVAGGVVLARNTDGLITVTDGEPEAGQLAVPGDAVAQGLAAPPFNYTFHGYTAGALKVTEPVLATPGYQEAHVRRPYEVSELRDGDGRVVDTLPDHGAILTVYRPGVFDPARYLGQEEITVGGLPGYYAADMPYRDEPGGGIARPGVAWRYADDAWAVISTVSATPYPRQDLIAAAAGLRTVAAYPATVPIDLVTVPDGYALASGGTADDFPNGTAAMLGSVRLVAGRGEYRGLTTPVDASAAGVPTVRIALYDAAWADGTRGLAPGAPATCAGDDLCHRLSADGRWLTEAHTSGGRLKTALLQRVLDEAITADVPDRGTWFPLTDAAS